MPARQFAGSQSLLSLRAGFARAVKASAASTASRRRLAFLPLLLGLAAATLSCGGADLVLPEEGQPTKVVVAGGDGQIGPAGAALAEELTVLVTNASGRPVAGQPVVFTFPQGANAGTLSPNTALTDAEGHASTAWTLGPGSGAQSVHAALLVGGVPSSTLAVNFSATATSGGATELKAVGGDRQTGAVGSALPDSLVVKVVDAFGNPVAGITVRWTIVSGGGSVDPAAAVTGADGRAATQRVLGSAAGTQRAQAAVDGLGGSPVAFQHTAVAASPAQLLYVSGSGVQAPAGSQLAAPLVVRLVDADNNGIGGRSVSWVVSARSGSVDPVNAVTDAEGYASTRWTLSSVIGGNSVNAVFSGLPAVLFTATGTADVPKTIVLDGGDRQSGTVGATLPAPLAVKITDARNIPVAGVAVTWTAQGGGTVNGAATTTTATDANGIARANRALGALPGTYTTTAARAGLAGSPVTFTATATIGAATRLAVVTQPSSGAASGAPLAVQPAVQLQDGQKNAVPQAGVPITVSVSGGVRLDGPRIVQTDANGRATFAGLAISAAAGTYTLTFTSGSLTPVTSGNIKVTPGAAAKLAIARQPSGSAVSGQAFAQQPIVEVQDAAGNPIGGAGRTIAAELASGAGTLGGTLSATTAATSRATFTNLQITGAAGTRTLRFTSSGLTGVESGAITLTAGSASGIAVQGGDQQTAVVGTVLPTDPSVIVRDAGGNPVQGVAITFAVASGGGRVTGPTQTTNAQGIATVGSWQLGPAAGANTLTASAPGLNGSPVTFTATGTAGAAAKLAMITQPSASVTSGQIFPQQPVVEVQDEAGNPVTAAGRSVTVAIAAGGGTLSGDLSIQTDGSGRAAFAGLAINGGTGPRTLRFTSSGVSAVNASPVAVGAGAATQVAPQAGNNQTAAAGAVLPVDPAVVVRDAGGNPVQGVAVTFAIASGGGSVTGASQTTNAQGIATVGAWQLGPVAGTNTLTASAPGLTGSPVTFTATGTAGAAAKLAMITQPSASVTSGQIFPQQPVVEVQDASGNPVATAGRTVTAAITSGGGTLGGDLSVQTDGNGRATFADLSIGGSAGPRTLRFTSSGVSGVNSSTVAVGAGAATQIASQGGNNQTATAGAVLPVDPAVIVRDADGNPVQGVAVTFAVASGGGTVNGPSQTTNAQGIATVGSWQLGPSAGANTMTATAPGLSGSPVTFTATATAFATTTAIASSGSPSNVGELVTFTATISSGGGTPAGSVRWTVDGDEVATTTLSGGQTTFATAALAAGSHAVRAQYLGGGAFAGSQSGSLTQSVEKLATTTTITSDDPDPSSVGQSVAVAFSVTGGGGTPTGTVTVTANGGLESCSASVAAGSCNLTLLVAGNRTLTATYGGDAAHAASAGTEAHQVVVLNSPPQANDDAYSLTQGGSLSVSGADGVLHNDTDPESSPLTATLVSGPAQDAGFVLNADGSFSYNPPADFTGTDSFTYRVSDGSAQSAVATVTITVDPAAPPSARVGRVRGR